MPQRRIQTALILLGIWLLAGFYLLLLTKIKGGPGDPVEEAFSRLESRVGQLEATIDNQRQEHRRLVHAYEDLLAFRKRLLRPRVLPVLVIACNRPVAAKNHINKLLALRGSKELHPIIVSQDCGHEPTAALLRSFNNNITFLQQPNQSDFTVPKAHKKWKNYYKIARHYQFALGAVFSNPAVDAIIVTEDDLDVSADFFQFFRATYPLLRQDESLMCVAAWNDNGKPELIDLQRPELLHRTDFFPGLGWMLRRRLWEELQVKWPASFWDDWLREGAQTRGRACIRPEISRTAMSKHGIKGVSQGLWFDQHLSKIFLNPDFVDFETLNLDYLLKSQHDGPFKKKVYEDAQQMTAQEVFALSEQQNEHKQPVRILYRNPKEYHAAAEIFGLMNDFRSGVPRTGYLGVVPFFYKGIRVFLAPPPDWTTYSPNWH